jgi:hypothetical protein
MFLNALTADSLATSRAKLFPRLYSGGQDIATPAFSMTSVRVRDAPTCGAPRVADPLAVPVRALPVRCHVAESAFAATKNEKTPRAAGLS